MDFGAAAIVVGLVWILTAAVKRTVPNMPSQVTPVVALALGVAALFLAGETVWAHTSIIGDIPLDQMSAADKVVAGLFLGTGGAGALHEGGKIVKSIGQNTDDPVA